MSKQNRGSRSIRRSTIVESLEPRCLLSVNILVHHGDAMNDGANLAETVLTPSNVNSTDFGRQFTTTLDGAIYAQPLYVQNVDITRGSSIGVHSVLYVATMHDSLYAIDANSGAILWQDSFLNITDPTNLAATAGVTTVSSTDINDTTLGPELGILATPAIDLNNSELFLNANTAEVRGTDTHFVQRLWAVNLADGSEAVQPAVIGDTISNNGFTSFAGYQYVAGPIVDGSGNNATPTTYPNTDGWVSAPGGATTPVIAFNALIQMQRTSVTLLNGNVYLGFASHGDNGPYYGWVLGFSESNLALTAAFVTTPTYEGVAGDSPDYTAQGGIWASGSAIATDGTYLYVVTGNGAFNTNAGNFNARGFPIDNDYGDSLLKLGPDPSSSSANENGNGWGLSVADYFTPSNAFHLNRLDLDLGSGGVLLLPNNLTDAAGNPMLIFGGKESRIYLIDRNNLGKFQPGYPTTDATPDPRLYDHVLGEYASDGIDGTAQGVYSTPAYFNGQFYVGIARSAALTFSVSTFASGSNPPGTAYTPTPLQQTPVFSYPDPTFSISANGNTDGIVWGMNVGNSDLLAFAATNITTPIYDSNTVASDEYTGSVKFGVVTVANGAAYLADTAGTIVGYGLHGSYLASDPAFFRNPTNLSVEAISPTDNQVSWTSNSTLASEFRVDRSTDNATWTTLAYVQGALSSYDDTTAAAGTNYFYRVVPVAIASVPSNIGSISGTVFDDANGNGVQDSGEAGIAGVTVYIDATNAGVFKTGDLETTTNSLGAYTLGGLAGGTYIVRQILPSDDKQDYPTLGYGNHITIAAGQTVSNANFGDQMPTVVLASITGTVFDDANGNGVQDSGELGIAGVSVYIDPNNAGVFKVGDLETTTNASGVYSFSGLAGGTYIVRQILPSGDKQIFPANGFGNHVTVTTGEAAANANFGDEGSTITPPPPGGSISGTVFNDANSNGKQDSGELGIAGVSVYIDAANAGVFKIGDLETTTNSSGSYSFIGLAAGSYIVRQILPGGDKQDYPTLGYGNHVTLAAGQAVTNANFGDQSSAVVLASISGTVFDDANGNGIQDSGESGIAGVVMYIDLDNAGVFQSGDPETTTNSAGVYNFTGLAAGTYIVRQIVPSGDKQTSPTKGYGQHVTVAAGQAASGANFGDGA